MNIESRMKKLFANESAEVGGRLLTSRGTQELKKVLVVSLNKLLESLFKYKYLNEDWRAANIATIHRKGGKEHVKEV
jgi:hypothetical protein